jgi:hypothetical protein
MADDGMGAALGMAGVSACMRAAAG